MLVCFVVTGSFNRPTLPTVAAVEGLRVGVYWDKECTEEVQAINWGVSQPGELETIIVFLRNEWNTPIHLFLNTTDWVPIEAAEWINFDWDYNGQRLDIGDITSVTFKLLVYTDANGIASFSFKTQIIGEEAPSPQQNDTKPSLLRGDVNMDGKITIADAMFIAQYLAGNRPASNLNLLNAASVKHDQAEGDKISIADAMFIAQYLVGLRDESFELIV